MKDRAASGGTKWATAVVVPAQTSGAVPQRTLAVEVAADEDAQARARAAPRLLGDLQRQPVSRHDVVAADDAFVLDAEDLIEIDAPERHKRRGRVGGRPNSRLKAGTNCSRR